MTPELDPTEVERVARGLTPLEAEWLTGWNGPPGAAYNVIGEGLQEAGLLDLSWQKTHKGILVRAHLLREQQGEQG